MATHELVIKYKGDRDGWRVVPAQKPDEINTNPSVERGENIRWSSPDIDACIAFMPDSPFTDVKQQGPILYIKKGQSSQEFVISDVEKGTYEYAALVRLANGSYTYVRGASSPPGVVIGP